MPMLKLSQQLVQNLNLIATLEQVTAVDRHLAVTKPAILRATGPPFGQHDVRHDVEQEKQDQF